jgi:hypothetical protein
MRRIAFFALTAASLSACSLDSLGPSASVPGTYTLRKINGSTLPYTFTSGQRLISDDLTLYRDGTFIDVSRYDTGETITDEGFYTNDNGSLNFESSETGLVYQGSITDDVLTEVVNGFTQVFERQ